MGKEPPAVFGPTVLSQKGGREAKVCKRKTKFVTLEFQVPHYIQAHLLPKKDPQLQNWEGVWPISPPNFVDWGNELKP